MAAAMVSGQGGSEVVMVMTVSGLGMVDSVEMVNRIVTAMSGLENCRCLRSGVQRLSCR